MFKKQGVSDNVRMRVEMVFSGASRQGGYARTTYYLGTTRAVTFVDCLHTQPRFFKSKDTDDRFDIFRVMVGSL